MIFTSVNEISNKTELAFFKEQINVYIRLVEVYCEKSSCSMIVNSNTPVIEELIRIGVISTEDEMKNLEEILGKDFERFIRSVRFALENQEELKGVLAKLSNFERKQMQENASDKMTLVDFFCGAGGLSLGFLQEGFNVKLANDIEDVCIQTYKYNHPELPSNRLIQGDIKQIVDNIEDFIDGDIDIVVGGPPCQGFSEANRQRVIDDPRNKLYKYFIQADSSKVCGNGKCEGDA